MTDSIAAVIKRTAPNAHYVGGIVRSSLLKRWSGDIDLTLPKEEVKKTALALAKKLHAAVFEMDPQFGVWRLVTHREGLQIDLSAWQGNTLKEDLLRRDFTFNSLAYPTTAPVQISLKKQDGKTRVLLKGLRRAQIVDYSNGMQAVRERVIRLNSPRVLAQDPLRMLRAFRCAAELKFTIDGSVLRQIKKDASLIWQSAGERIQEELVRLFNTSQAYENVVLMDKCGLLTAVFPALEPQRTCAEVYYGKGGVLTHTLNTLRRMEFLLDNLPKAFPKYAKKLAPLAQDKALFKMTALLHDLAKPSTAKVVGDRLRFFYHEERGARMAKKELEKLHYSRADMRLICAMIAEHLRPSNLASNDVITDRGAYHFFRDLGDAALPLLLLCWSDYTSYVTDAQIRRILPRSGERMMSLKRAKKTANIGKTLRHLQVLSLLLKKYFEQPKKIKPTQLINGREIMQALNIKPGPQVGELLEKVADAQVDGKVVTKEDALAFLKSLPLSAPEK